MNVEVYSPVSAWLREGGTKKMGFDGLMDHTSRAFGSGNATRRVESVTWLQLSEREVVKPTKSWHDFSSTYVLTTPLKPANVQPGVKNLTIRVEASVEKSLYEVEGIECYFSKFEDASLIPRIPDDVAKSCLALIPREDFPSIRHVCKSWWEYVQTREFYHTRKTVGTLEEWLYVMTVTPDLTNYHWEVLTPKAKEWKVLPGSLEVREGGTTIVFNNKLMLIGGVSRVKGKISLADVFVYEPVTDRWVKGASLKQPRYQHACGVLDGKLYVVGGYGPDDKGLSSMEVYDPEKNEWTLSTPLRKPRWSCFAAGVGGKLYVMGGRSSFTLGFARTIDVYDPKTGKWTELKNGCQMVVTHAVIDDKVYCLEWKDERSLKVFNTTDNSWTKILLPLPSNMRENFCLGSFGGKLLLFPSSQRTKNTATLMYNPKAAKGSEWESTDIKASGPCLGFAALTA